MKKTVLFGRVWHTEENADPGDWTGIPPECGSAVPVKKSTTRTVERITGLSGKEYFIKRYARRGIRDLFFPKAKAEYRSYDLLKENGIPSAEYLGWSDGPSGSVLVSAALGRDWFSFPEFWHTHGDRKIREGLIRSLGFFLSIFFEKKIFHPDFHIGNLMVHSSLELKSVDPGGIRRKFFWDDPIRMGACFADLRNGLSLQEQVKLLADTPLFGGKQERIRDFLGQAGARADQRILREWPRRKKQILSGSSKFARELSPGRWIRNSAWFACMELPAADQLQQEIFPIKEGETLWTDSFLQFLLGKDISRIPVSFEKRGDYCGLQFLPDKKKALFYGFAEKN